MDTKLPHPLDRLYGRILERESAPPEGSYTAKLLREGIGKIAKKVGEEAVETALAAVARDKSAVIGESADLLYHLLVLWAASGIAPEEIYLALDARAGRSGLAEKESRTDEEN
jgi:phosphoribosyl-ATP pyrophosphohydrolase